MTTVSKGALRTAKLKAGRLMRAVPTLDLRRKQLNREILTWEEEVERAAQSAQELERRFGENPHAVIEKIVSVEGVETKTTNVAGVLLEEVERVRFAPIRFSLISTPPSFDLFVSLRRELLEEQERLAYKRRALEILLEELMVTTQRINLFEKRLIPQYEGEIRYIKGRLEDNERASVMVAKIAQRERLAEHGAFESA